MTKILIYMLFLLLSLNSELYASETGSNNKELDSIYREIRCVTCAGQSIHDSMAPMAVEMRDIVKEMYQNGSNKEEILNFLSSRYGDAILQKPPVNNQTLVLWLLPFVVTLLGVLILLITNKNSRKEKDNV